MIKKNLLIAGAMLLILTAFSVNKAQAQTCVVPPSCEDLGYTMTEADCGNAVKFLKCPHDQSKMFCLSQEEVDGNTVAHVGDIMYSDKTFSTELIKTKTPIGVVFDDANHLAVALDQTSLYWSPETVNIPALGDCSEAFSCSTNGKQNTAAIMTYVKTNGKTGKYPAAEYCTSYKPSTVYQDEVWYAEGQWFLPSMKELQTLYNNKAVVNASLQKVNAVTLTNSLYWSSTEYTNNYAWYLDMYNGNTHFTTKNYNDCYVRPVLAF